ncbi:MAG: D-tyrosyl-tRNA(Tyr) deacylase [Planctomycetes bacterium RIFCSPHIGHO2_12_FULL_52_36]|nr:MAG: D-tyrosyl-tRNA(Tyr) deacylase [Planctomycetes bacterium RIFCSPHIGHO2_02_FULL_52_58]OHB94463.1 MAG: D-tyrosyl-tRNA(Tyr) deacylase [Planctomycetes bacterium RIFCSPHIGHO2_12_FULL_52_36]
MRAVVQRVSYAQVKVEGELISRIGRGLVVLVGVGVGDAEEDVEYLAAKLSGLRVFEDSNGKMNLSLEEVNGQMLLVSQFTLYGDCRKGRRPSFDQSAGAETAQRLYNLLVESLRRKGIVVAEGKFQEKMLIELANDGPVTLLLDSKRHF